MEIFRKMCAILIILVFGVCLAVAPVVAQSSTIVTTQATKPSREKAAVVDQGAAQVDGWMKKFCDANPVVCVLQDKHKGKKSYLHPYPEDLANQYNQ